jgi:D-alanine transaminase
MVSLNQWPESIAYLAGEFVKLKDAKISPMDRGFLFGDGVYEVIPVYAGRAFLLSEHLDRLERSLQELSIPNPHSRAEWVALVRELIAQNSGGDLSVYLQVSRGVEMQRNHAIPSHCTPTVFLMAQALPPLPPSLLSEGAKAITTEDLRWLRCDIKSVNLLPNVLAKSQAVAADALEALLIRDGHLMEGSSSSTLIVTRGELIAPAYSRELLPGTTRNLLQTLAQSLGIAVRIQSISLAQLQSADEVLIGFATRGVIPITQIDGQPVGSGKPGPVFKQLRQRFDERRLNPVAG